MATAGYAQSAVFVELANVFKLEITSAVVTPLKAAMFEAVSITALSYATASSYAVGAVFTELAYVVAIEL